MKTTPELLRARRKQRRAESRSKANQSMLAICEIIDLNTSYMEGTFGMPSIKEEPTKNLAALLKLGRRVRPMLDCARRELDRRYQEETYRRRRELKKQYKAAILKEIAFKQALAEEKKSKG